MHSQFVYHFIVAQWHILQYSVCYTYCNFPVCLFFHIAWCSVLPFSTKFCVWIIWYVCYNALWGYGDLCTWDFSGIMSWTINMLPNLNKSPAKIRVSFFLCEQSFSFLCEQFFYRMTGFLVSTFGTLEPRSCWSPLEQVYSMDVVANGLSLYVVFCCYESICDVVLHRPHPPSSVYLPLPQQTRIHHDKWRL